MGIKLDNQAGNISVPGGQIKIEGQAFPTTSGSENQFLMTDGSNVMNWASLMMSDTLFVSPDGDDSAGDGSITKPYATIQEAVDNASSSTVIIIQPGTYVESVTIEEDNIHLMGYGAGSGNNTLIFGKVTVTGDDVVMSDISVDFNTGYALEINAAIGFRSFSCAFRRSSSTATAVYHTGVIADENWLVNTNIVGYVESVHTGGGSLIITGGSSSEFSVRANTADGSVVVNNVPVMHIAEHLAGKLVLRNIGQMGKNGSNQSIVSAVASSSANHLLMENINLQQSDYTFGIIAKSGTCSYTLLGVNYDAATSTLTGTLQSKGMPATMIPVTFTATEYTAASATVEAHLSAIDAALGDVAEATSDVVFSNTVVVATDGDDDDGTGSINQPYATIAHAISVASAGDVILIAPGTYTEDITITTSSLRLIAMGGNAVQPVTIVGNIYLNGADNCSFSHLRVYNEDDIALTMSGGITGNKFYQCNFERSDEDDVAVEITGVVSGNIDFVGCYIVGEFSNAGLGGSVNLNACTGLQLHVRTQTEYSKTVVSNSPVVGYAFHLDGVLVMSNITKIGIDGDGASVISTAAIPDDGVNFLSLTEVNFLQDDFTHGVISKSGTCQYAISDCNRNPTFDTLTGTRAFFGRVADDISGNYDADNYTPDSDSLVDHLEAIDEALAAASGGTTTITQVIFVTKGGNDGTGTGTLGKPYLTVKAAVDAISDATTSKRYVVAVGPGTYTEVSGFALKNYVSIHGFSPATTIVQRDDGAGGYQNHALTIGDVAGYFQMRNLSLGASGLTVTHTSPSGNVLTVALVNTAVGAAGLSVTGVGAGRDVFTMSADSSVDGTALLVGVSATMSRTTMAGTVTVQNGSASFADGGGFITDATFRDCTLTSALVKNTARMSIYGSTISGTATAQDTSIARIDAVSMPVTANLAIAGTATLTRLTTGHGVGYTPTTTLDWSFASGTPAKVDTALDYLATRVKATSAAVAAQNVLYVSKNGNDTTGSGSEINPYLTIAKAVAVAATDSIIVIYPGTYTENITLNNKSGLHIYGVGPVVMNGRFLLSGSSTINGLFQNISFTNTGAVTVWVSNATNLRFVNCPITRGDGAANVAIRVDSTSVTGEVSFEYCDISATAEILGSQQVIFRGIDNSNFRLETQTESSITVVEDSPVIGYVTHESGMLSLRNIGRIVKASASGDSIISNCGVGASSGNRLSVDNVSLVQSDNTVGKINKTGLCPYILTAVARTPSQDILTGTRQRFNLLGDDMGGNYTPSSYTASTDAIKSHLTGIDTKLATLTTLAGSYSYTNVYYVAPNGSNSNAGGGNTPFLTIQHALTTIGASSSTSEQQKRFVIFIAPGIYDETLTVPVGRNIALLGLGPWTLGDAITPTNSRNITVLTDGAVVDSGYLRPSLTVGTILDGSTAYARSSHTEGATISGSILVSAGATSSAVDIHLINTRVMGGMSGTQTEEIGIYAYKSYVTTAVTMAAAKFVDIVDSSFLAAVSVKSFNHISGSKFGNGITVTENTIPNTTGVPVGIFDSDIYGIFTGPATSFKVDATTYRMFLNNSGLLGGSATITYLSYVAPGSIALADYTATRYTPASTTIAGHLEGINNALTGQTITTSYGATGYTPANTTVTAHLAAIDAALASAGLVGMDIENVRFVAKNGSDTTGDGSFRAPYLSVKAAVDSISDAEIDNPYAIIVGPGTYTEISTFALIPNVSIIGAGASLTEILRDSGGLLSIELDIPSNDGGYVLFKDLSFGASGLLITHETGATDPLKIEIINCTDTNNIEFDGVGAGVDTIYFTNYVTTSSPQLQGVYGYFYNCQIYGTLTLNDTGGVNADGETYRAHYVFYSCILEDLDLASTTSTHVEVYSTKIVDFALSGAGTTITGDGASLGTVIPTSASNLKNIAIQPMDTITLVDNTASATTIITIPVVVNAIIDYSITRATTTRVGTIHVATNGSAVDINDVTADVGSVGVTLTAIVSGTDVLIQYTTTSTGNAATMKAQVRYW